MITLFSIMKGFSGHSAIVQDNALGSWTRLGNDCEVVLFGDDPGMGDAAARHGVRHEPNIARNEHGTPILRDVFMRINEIARNPIVCFVNADIILLPDFLDSVRTASRLRDKFMVVSARFNCRITEPLPFDDGWDASLRERARRENSMYPAAGSDLFAYPRGLIDDMPPFAIGRGYWDNWLMIAARQKSASLIDATPVLTAVHHEHTYNHIAGLPGDSETHVYETNEGRLNLSLAGGRRSLYTVFDATEVLTPDGRLVSTLRPNLVRRRLKAWARRQWMARGEPIRLPAASTLAR